jgi:hypothetical protein
MSPHSKINSHSKNTVPKELYLFNIYLKFGSKKVAMDMVSMVNELVGIFVWITKNMMKIKKTTYVDKLGIRDSKSACGSHHALKQKWLICITLKNHRIKDKNI